VESTAEAILFASAVPGFPLRHKRDIAPVHNAIPDHIRARMILRRCTGFAEVTSRYGGFADGRRRQLQVSTIHYAVTVDVSERRRLGVRIK